MTFLLDTFTGFVDCAAIVCSTNDRARLFINGWILLTDHPVSALSFSISDGAEVAASWIERPDVARAQPHIAHALTSGFQVSIPVERIERTYQVTFRVRNTTGSEIQSTITVRPVLSPPFVDIVKFVCSGNSRSNSKTSTPGNSSQTDSRAEILSECSLRFRNFIQSSAQVTHKRPRSARISVIIPVYGQTHLTFACLETLGSYSIPGLEIIVVDNDRSNETRDLVSRFSGVRYVPTSTKRSFSHACNLGAQNARGKFLLFLNNDAFPAPGAIEAALARAENDPLCGVVGAKLIRADGLLQEVGSFILPTASTVSRGRGCVVDDPSFNVPIRVDYCSAAFLLTPKSIFHQLKGFDERFDPAYYEDADYCLRLSKAGYTCIVEPASKVLHLEGGTSKDILDVSLLMRQGREVFQGLHPEFGRKLGHIVTSQRKPKKVTRKIRAQKMKPLKILVIDDRVPDPVQGQGQGRASLILETLLDFNLNVSLYAVQGLSHSKAACHVPSVSVLSPIQNEPRVDFLRRVLPTFDTVIVSRPHHMEDIQIALRSFPTLLNVPRIVYDAEALQATREILHFEIANNTVLTEDEVETILRSEIILAQDADTILAASELEATVFADFGYSDPVIIGYGVTPQPTATPFVQREHFLAVGPLLEHDTPNSDGLLWFLQEIYAHIVSLMRTSRIRLDHAGDCRVKELYELQGPGFALLGQLIDLAPVYGSHRVYLAPTRYSAGIPLKVIEAAAHGIPSVITPVLARQLGWRDGVETLIGSDPVEFAMKCVELYTNERLWQEIRLKALARVEEQFSITQFKTQLSAALELGTDAPAAISQLSPGSPSC